MRKTSTRMENENNYSVLSYFNYLKQNGCDLTENGPLDIYKIGGRIAIRLRSKGDISKVLENTKKKDAFVAAVNDLEFTFVRNLKLLLSDEGDSSEKTLSKNLDMLLGIENNRRTQQSFYALWYFFNGLDRENFCKKQKEIIVKTKELFKAMSSDIKRTDFIKMVDDFRTQYKNNEDLEVVKIRLGDIMDFIAFDGDSLKNSAEVDFYVKRDNKIKDQIQIRYERPENVEAYYGCHINRLGFCQSYIAAMLQSSYVYREYDFRSRNVSVVSLKDIMIPYVPLSIQKVFDKMMNYTKTPEYIQSSFL